MALEVKSAQRNFVLEKGGKKIELKDPNPNMTIQEVVNHYSGEHPQLATANVEGPEMKDGKAVYKFTTVLGTKG